MPSMSKCIWRGLVSHQLPSRKSARSARTPQTLRPSALRALISTAGGGMRSASASGMAMREAVRSDERSMLAMRQVRLAS